MSAFTLRLSRLMTACVVLLGVTGHATASTWVPIGSGGTLIFVPVPSLDNIEAQPFYYSKSDVVLTLAGFNDTSAIYYQTQTLENGSWVNLDKSESNPWACHDKAQLSTDSNALKMSFANTGRYRVNVAAAMINEVCDVAAFKADTLIASTPILSNEFMVLDQTTLPTSLANIVQNPLKVGGLYQSYDLQLNWPQFEGTEFYQLTLKKDHVPYYFDITEAEYQNNFGQGKSNFYPIVDEYFSATNTFTPHTGFGQYTFAVKYCFNDQCSQDLDYQGTPLNVAILPLKDFSAHLIGGYNQVLLISEADARTPKISFSDFFRPESDPGNGSTSTVPFKVPDTQTTIYSHGRNNIYYRQYTKNIDGRSTYSGRACVTNEGYSCSPFVRYNTEVVINASNTLPSGDVDAYVPGSDQITGWANDGDGVSYVKVLVNSQLISSSNGIKANEPRNTNEPLNGYTVPGLTAKLNAANIDTNEPLNVEVHALDVGNIVSNTYVKIKSFIIHDFYNASPIAISDAIQGSQDGATIINVLNNDSDLESHTLSILNNTQPTYGSLVLNADQTFTYTHNAASTAPSDTFTYQIQDELGAPSTYANVVIYFSDYVAKDDEVYVDWATDSSASITSNAASFNGSLSNARQRDSAITANSGPTGTTTKSVDIDVLFNDVNANFGSVEIEIENPITANGRASINANNTVTYTLTGDLQEQECFTYNLKKAGVDKSNSAEACVISGAKPFDDHTGVAPNTAKDIYVLNNDFMGLNGVGRYEPFIRQHPAKGTVSVHSTIQSATAMLGDSDVFIRYTPDAGKTGPDSFTYSLKTTNGLPSLATATVYLEIGNLPNIPGNFQISQGAQEDSINVSWSNNSSPSYQLQQHIASKVVTTRSIEDYQWATVSDSVSAKTAYTFSGLENGYYHYRMRACGQVEYACSDWFNSASYIKIATAQPDQPDDQPFTQALPPVDSASDRVGVTAGSFRVDESGAASYSIPVTIPAGIAGVTPEVSLSYNSNAGNGTVGMGWNIGGMSSISRCRSTQEQEEEIKPISLTRSDRLCIDGQKLIAVANSSGTTGTYGASGTQYRTEIDSKTRITSHSSTTTGPTYFTVEREDGSIHYYGNQGFDGIARTDSLMRTSDGVILNWMLTSITDNMRQADNTVVFEYLNGTADDLGDREIVIDKISYSDNAIDFTYRQETDSTYVREDNRFGYLHGEEVGGVALLDSIVVSNHDNLAIRSYHLNYQADSVTNAQQLQTVQECNGSATGVCLTPTTFDWYGGVINTVSSNEVTCSVDNNCFEGMALLGSQPIDYNGDGFMDLSIVTQTKGAPNNNEFKLTILKNTAGSLGVAESRFDDIVFYSNDVSKVKWHIVDADGDGLQDIIIRNATAPNGFPHWYLYRNDPSDANGFDVSIIPFEKPNNEVPELFLMDFNSDGLVDIISNRTDDVNNVDYYSVRLNNKGNFGVLTDRIDFYSTDAFDDYRISNIERTIVGDFDGDGVGDVIARMELTPAGERKADANCTLANNYICDYPRYYWQSFVTRFDDQGNPYFEPFSIVHKAITSRFLGTLGMRNITTGDINGDGLTDLLYGYHNPDVLHYKLATGTGFTDGMVTNAPQNGVTFTQIMDVNADGHGDLVYFDKTDTANAYWYYHPSSKDGFSPRVAISARVAKTTFDQAFFVDLNGDGKADSISVDYSDKAIKFHLVTKEPTPDNRIHTITNGFDIKTVINYKLMTDASVYTKGTGANTLNWGKGSPVFDVISPGFLVEKVTSDTPSTANAADTLSVSYHYEGMRMQSGGRGSLGFLRLSTTDDQNAINTTTQYNQNWPYIGLPDSTVQYLDTRKTNPFDITQVPENKRLSWSENTLVDTLMLHGNKVRMPYIKQATEKTYVVNTGASVSQHISTTTTTSTYNADLGSDVDASGSFACAVNASDNTNYGLLSMMSINTSSADGTATKNTTTRNCYDNENTTKWWTNRISATKVQHTLGTDSEFKHSSFEYDNNTGLLSAQIIDPTGGNDTYLKTAYDHDSYGNKTKVTQCSKHYAGSCGTNTGNMDDLNGDDELLIYRQSFIEYDAYRYVNETRNSKFTSMTVNSVNHLGQPTNATDTNGNTSQTVYGTFGQSQYSSSNIGRWSKTIKRYKDEATAFPTIAVDYKFAQQQTSATKPTQWAYFDKMGRQVASVTQGFDGSEKIYQYTRYDKYSRTLGTSLPSKDPVVAATDFNVNEYDKYSRLLKTTAVDDSTVETTVLGLTTKITTISGVNGYQINQSQSSTGNVFGQTVSVKDNNQQEISYSYNVMGGLKTVKGVDNVVITTLLDKFGRKYRMIDPNKGTWHYSYNALGQLINQTDAKDQYTQVQYDLFGRKVGQQIKTTATGLVVDNMSWTYADKDSTALKTLGKLISQTANGTSRSYVYDSYGRLNTATTTLDGQNFTQRTTYDKYGRVFQQFDASGDSRGIRNHYQNGYLIKQQEAREGAMGVVYHEIDEVDAFGHVKEFTQGNGVVTTNSYNNKNGKLNAIQAQAKGSSLLLQENEYVFDAVGNLRRRTRNTLEANISVDINGVMQPIQNQTFNYDNLNRLTHINNIEQVKYHNNGNLDWKIDLNNGAGGHYCYQANRPNAVSGISTSTGCAANDFSYDANGNMTAGRGNTIEYGAFDKPTEITSSGEETQFSYGLGHSRFKRVDTKGSVTTTTYYIGNVEVISKSSSNVITTRRNLGGAIHRVLSNGAVELDYLHKDHLGSIDTITDTSGKIKQKLYFDTWGQKVVIDNSLMIDALEYTATTITLDQLLEITNRGFTGHEGVEHANIIHMNGRIYDPTLARFLQADPIIQAAQNSQNLNRYSYVLNNPLSFTDPSGYSFKSIMGGLLGKPGAQIADAFAGGWVYNRVMKSQWLSTGGSIALNFIPGCQVWCSALFTAQRTYYQTGSLGASFHAGGRSAAISGILMQIGGDATMGIAGSPQNIFANAMVGGVASVLEGGKFGHGFFAAGFASAFKPMINKIGAKADLATFRPHRVAVAALIGGTASVISGGKFANGAATGAFNQMFNGETGLRRERSQNALAGADENSYWDHFWRRWDKVQSDITTTADFAVDHWIEQDNPFMGTLAATLTTENIKGTTINLTVGAVGAVWQVPKTVYHFTSAANAASITAGGVIQVGSRNMWGAGVYTTRWNSRIMALLSGAASVEARIVISTQGSGLVPSLFIPGTFRTLGTGLKL